MVIEKKETLLSIGMFCLSIAIILRIFIDESGVIDFFEGVLTGLSIVFNITYLTKIRKNLNF
jgi:hypothetical protein